MNTNDIFTPDDLARGVSRAYRIVGQAIYLSACTVATVATLVAIMAAR